MNDKISLTPLVNLTNQTTAVNAINANNAILTTALDNTLSRDGTPPNQMGSAIDMNSNRILNLPTAISTSEPVTLNQMNLALVANGNTNTGLTGVPVSAAMQPVVNATTIASAQSQLKIPTPYVDATLYGATGNGVTDDTAAIQAAITAAAGQEVYLGPGTYVVSSQLHYITSSNFVAGLHLRGAGEEKTTIDNRVANNSCIYSAGASGAFQLGGWVKDLTIKTTTNPVNSHGIEHLAAYQYTVENVHVIGLSGDGLRITCNIGDLDASNEMTYRNCRVENCNNGLNCNFGSGLVQPSFMKLDSCFFQANVNGVKWAGLSCSMINCAFAINTKYGLWIYNNATNNAQFSAFGNSFENNAQAIQIDSLQGGEFIQTELAGSNSFVTSTAAVVVTTGIGIRFSGSRIRISSSPHTLWTFTGSATNYNIITNSFYQNYDNSGQTRYSVVSSSFGNRLDDSFDSIITGQANGVSSITAVNGTNNNVAVPITGAIFGLSGPSSSFSITGFTNGFDGRRLTVINNTGQVLTLIPLSGSSSAANQITADSGSNVTINNAGSFVLVYTVLDSRWHLVGHG